VLFRSVGKSLLTAALCRIFARAGHRVAPFKAQNMSLNAAVTVDGGEIGRAQAVQAAAAGIEPTVDMNPILLKPEADDRSQIVVHGRARGSACWRDYMQMAPTLWPAIVDSLERLRCTHDLVMIEGAGSPAEINLSVDLANMRIAALADAPVVLVGDIERGGVFAALVGTLALLAPDDRARVAGLVINRVRGDASLLRPGLDLVAAQTGVPVLGVVPHLGAAALPEEDSLDLFANGRDLRDARIVIAVPRLPHIANFDDVEPLAAEPGVAVRFVARAEAIDDADIVVVPGSKTTLADLAWLRERGLDAAIRGAAHDGRLVIGVCGGYQMLGERLEDPEHVESSITSAAGLGVLPIVTTFERHKITRRVHGTVLPGGPLDAAAGAPFEGYEIHCGRTSVHGGTPVLALAGGDDATVRTDGTAVGSVFGTYVHGCFASGPLRRALLEAAALRQGTDPDPRWGADTLADRYDRVADQVGASLDIDALARLVRRPIGAAVS